jgi:hypothetical protein
MARRTTRPQITEAPSGRASFRGQDVTRIEAMVAKTVKLPVSLDERLRRHCFETRRTGQEVMLEAVRIYLDGLAEE